MRQREERRKVMIAARVQLGVTWHDACILNISTRGLMVQAPNPPPRGQILELRRGRHIIVGRVVWSTRARCGLMTQDRLPIDELVSGADAQAVQSGAKTAERRAAVRSVENDAERSRWRGRAIEFGGIAAVAIGAAAGLAVLADTAIAKPMHAIQLALGTR